ncbi:MAG: peptidase T [Kiritimatiellae bacterium]|nr:peptidase T [Kiritimatiellia bacterium]
MTKLIDRFLRYIKVDTQANPNSGAHPTSPGQRILSHYLADELRQIGMENVRTSDQAYLYAELSATPGLENVPALGLIAHVDTSPDASGSNVCASIVEYEGGDIPLGDSGRILSPDEFPSLRRLVGHRLIVTDGTTLLGADNKAGVAEIIQAIDTIISKGTPHGKLCVAFTTDEELGFGADFFDVENFGAKYAYTIDGGAVGEIQYANFNAAQAHIKIVGKSIHTGSAKGIMKNASCIACEFESMLPPDETPQTTEDREGFYHLSSMKSGVGEGQMVYLLRDFDRAMLEERKQYIYGIADTLNQKYGEGTVLVDIEDQYLNMEEIIAQNPILIKLAEKAIYDVGYIPISWPVRGGTDGATLSYKGLPCPNLGTGGYNPHGVYEFASLNEMELAVDIILNIVDSLAKGITE